MAHRGRLNVLANIVGKSYEQIFREFEGELDPSVPQGSGDVKYHLGATRQVHDAPVGRDDRARRSPPTRATSRPSTRSSRAWRAPSRTGCGDDDARSRCCRCSIHGDAAFAGQGVVAETLNLSELPGYDVGGTVHIVVNNQLGFTTAPELRPLDACTRPTSPRSVQAPIFHVNGDDPEAAVRVDPARVRVPAGVQEGRRRRHGLLPALRPQRRRRAARSRSRAMYELIEQPPLGPQALHRAARATAATSRSRRPSRRSNDFRARLDARVRRDARAAHAAGRAPSSTSATPARGRDRRPSRPACRASVLDRIVDRARPRGPTASQSHPKLERSSSAAGAPSSTTTRSTGRSPRRSRSARSCSKARRCASPARTRGAARSASATRVLVDHDTEHEYAPLAHLADDQAPFMLYDSVLSEFAALGFEYGYSVADRDALVCWEAQFGDFANGAQIDHRPVHRRRRGQVGPAQRPRRCCSRTASRARAPSTRARGSSASSCCAPRTTSASSTRRPRRSTSTCCGARCTTATASR